MTKEDQQKLVAHIAIASHGTVDEQRAHLVLEIIETFTDPAKWPLTDSDRCAFCRYIYQMARTIKDTERAMNESVLP